MHEMKGREMTKPNKQYQPDLCQLHETRDPAERACPAHAQDALDDFLAHLGDIERALELGMDEMEERIDHDLHSTDIW
jgi:hypothetical protein